MWAKMFREFIRILLDLIIISVMIYINNEFWHLWQDYVFHPAKRGFFCNDETLRYPYKGDTVAWDIIAGVYVPIGVIFVLELCKIFNRAAHRNEKVVFCIYDFWPFYNTLRCFMFGFVAAEALKNVGKQTMGRLRPHFFAICMPVLKNGSEACPVGYDPSKFIADYDCTGSKVFQNITKKLENKSLYSFPSGHSTIIFYGMIFLVIYIQLQGQSKKLNKNIVNWLCWCFTTTLLRPLIQLLCLLVAWFVTLSRLLDHKHHWSDVTVGAIIGASCAALVGHYLYRSAKVAATKRKFKREFKLADGREMDIEDIDDLVITTTNTGRIVVAPFDAHTGHEMSSFTVKT